MYEGARTRVKECTIKGHDPSGHRATPRIMPEPLPFRHDGCVGLRDKARIYPRGASYMLMTLHWVAPEERRLKID